MKNGKKFKNKKIGSFLCFTKSHHFPIKRGYINYEFLVHGITRKQSSTTKKKQLKGIGQRRRTDGYNLKEQETETWV